jgi:hypothetical protein
MTQKKIIRLEKRLARIETKIANASVINFSIQEADRLYEQLLHLFSKEIELSSEKTKYYSARGLSKPGYCFYNPLPPFRTPIMGTDF